MPFSVLPIFDLPFSASLAASSARVGGQDQVGPAAQEDGLGGVDTFLQRPSVHGGRSPGR